MEPAQSLPHDQKDVEENKDLAALSYVWILSLLMIFTRRDSAFVKFHARQGVALFIVSLLAWSVPFVGKLIELLVLLLCAVGFLNAAQGEWRELPIVGPLSRGSVKDLRHSWRDVVDATVGLWSRLKKSGKDMKPDAPAQPEPPVAPTAPVTPPALSVVVPPPEIAAPPVEQALPEPSIPPFGS